MESSHQVPDQTFWSFVEQARALQAPKDKLTINAMGENHQWWDQHDSLIHKAWQEFGTGDQDLADFQAEFIHKDLRRAIDAVRAEPSAANEDALRAMWEEIVPGVYSC